MNPTKITIHQADLNNLEDAADYSAMLNAYVSDNMGLNKPFEANHLQQVVQDLGAEEAQNRFNIVFEKVVAAKDARTSYLGDLYKYINILNNQ